MTHALNALAEDLAIAAWNQVRQDSSEPDSVEVVSDAGFPLKTAIYRLREVGPAGSDVVAKRSRVNKAVVERAVYEQLLSGLPVRSLTFLGAAEERGSKFCWLFLEDARGDAFERERESHRALGDVWLAGLHTGAAELPRPADLPTNEPADHLAVLRIARKGVARCLLAEGSDADEHPLTEALVQLDLLERRWAEVAELCAGMPDTLQHGDFAGKNLIVEPAGTLVPVDWEAAGWGPPAVDLVFVDPARYHREVSGRWPDLSVGAIERAAAAGRIFRSLSALRWATRDYPAERSKRKLADQHGKLAEAMRTADLS